MGMGRYPGHGQRCRERTACFRLSAHGAWRPRDFGSGRICAWNINTVHLHCIATRMLESRECESFVDTYVSRVLLEDGQKGIGMRWIGNGCNRRCLFCSKGA